MDSLNTILNSGQYGAAVERHNDNYGKIQQALTRLENVALDPLTIKKTYATLTDAGADTNPIGDDGLAIKIGQIVSVTAENKVYRLKTLTSGVPTWESVGAIGDISTKADISIMNFNLLRGKTHVAGLGNPVVTILNNKMYISFVATTGEAIKYTNILEIGKTYIVAVKGNASSITVDNGRACFGYLSASQRADNVLLQLHDGSLYSLYQKKWRTGEFTASTVDFWIGKSVSGAANHKYMLDEVVLIEKIEKNVQLLNSYIAQDARITELEKATINKNILLQEDFDLSYSWLWKSSVGDPVLTIDGKMTVNFNAPGTNQCVINAGFGTLSFPGKKKIKFDVKLVSGTASQMQAGIFTGTPSTGTYLFTPTSISTTHEAVIDFTSGTSATFSFGSDASKNQGMVVEIDNISIEEFTEVNHVTDTSGIVYNNTVGVFPSLNQFNPHNEIKLIGDSLTANEIGGVIPDVETLASRRPFRLTSANNYARRLYDRYCANKPNWRRLDDADWVKTGVWSPINDTTLFEPIHTNDAYFKNITADSTAELSIPDGDEYLVLIIKEANNCGTINFQINGIPPTSGQGVSSFDCNYVSIGHTGNPYKKLLWNLPAGTSRKFKIIRDSTARDVWVWGAYSWSGSTIIFTPIAHGGHTMNDLLTQHYQDEYVRNKDFTNAVIFEVPEMNDMRTDSISLIKSYLSTWTNNLKDKDLLITTCNILGTDPRDGDPNYYITAQTNGFSQKQMNSAVKNMIVSTGLPFIDLFTIFERATIARGGTLDNGDAGMWTHDGQHGNENGVAIWANSIFKALDSTFV